MLQPTEHAEPLIIIYISYSSQHISAACLRIVKHQNIHAIKSYSSSRTCAYTHQNYTHQKSLSACTVPRAVPATVVQDTVRRRQHAQLAPGRSVLCKALSRVVYNFLLDLPLPDGPDESPRIQALRKRSSPGTTVQAHGYRGPPLKVRQSAHFHRRSLTDLRCNSLFSTCSKPARAPHM
jgi:hypothetical protein